MLGLAWRLNSLPGAPAHLPARSRPLRSTVATRAHTEEEEAQFTRLCTLNREAAALRGIVRAAMAAVEAAMAKVRRVHSVTTVRSSVTPLRISFPRSTCAMALAHSSCLRSQFSAAPCSTAPRSLLRSDRPPPPCSKRCPRPLWRWESRSPSPSPAPRSTRAGSRLTSSAGQLELRWRCPGRQWRACQWISESVRAGALARLGALASPSRISRLTRLRCHSVGVPRLELMPSPLRTLPSFPPPTPTPCLSR